MRTLLVTVTLNGAAVMLSLVAFLIRSWSLTKGYTGRLFVILLLYYVLAIGLGFMSESPISSALEASTRSGGDIRFWLAARQLANSLVFILVRPVAVIAITICYFDLRIRKEGFDLQFMMDPTSERATREPSNSDILSLCS